MHILKLFLHELGLPEWAKIQSVFSTQNLCPLSETFRL